MEREENNKLPFLDLLLANNSNQGIITSVFHKKTYTGLLTNYYSFVPFSYKLGLVRTLVERTFKINNVWLMTNDQNENFKRFSEEEVWNTTDHHWPACNQASLIYDTHTGFHIYTLHKKTLPL